MYFGKITIRITNRSHRIQYAAILIKNNIQEIAVRCMRNAAIETIPVAITSANVPG
jgi:hypothetical protein